SRISWITRWDTVFFVSTASSVELLRGMKEIPVRLRCDGLSHTTFHPALLAFCAAIVEAPPQPRGRAIQARFFRAGMQCPQHGLGASEYIVHRHEADGRFGRLAFMAIPGIREC